MRAYSHDIMQISQITDQILIGPAHLASRSGALAAREVDSVILLCESWEGLEWPEDVDVFHLPFEDAERIPDGYLEQIVTFGQEELEAGRTIMVCCAAGISRSSTGVLAILHSDGMPLPDAYRLLHKQHEPAAPHPALMRSLFQHFDLPYDWADLIAWRT